MFYFKKNRGNINKARQMVLNQGASFGGFQPNEEILQLQNQPML